MISYFILIHRQICTTGYILCGCNIHSCIIHTIREVLYLTIQEICIQSSLSFILVAFRNTKTRREGKTKQTKWTMMQVFHGEALSKQNVKALLPSLSCDSSHVSTEWYMYICIQCILLCFMARSHTGNYQIHKFDWLKSILKALQIFPFRLASRPVMFCSENFAN